MSDKVPSSKKTTGSSQDAIPPPATSRKRKAGRRVDTEHSPHAEPTPRGAQGRRSDLRPTAPAHRRVSDVHRTRKSNMPHPSSRPHRRASVPPGPPRTMLQHAWHTVLHSDPLMDSDEDCPDEHLRLDYNRRMQVITRLRGRPPTPEADQPN